ncbi:hypothetical protein KBT16_01305 [Nostoc sp. CCCryo 231-06]|nr:hypothetical protein [Nostoc sp. CCCryo 231-06]
MGYISRLAIAIAAIIFVIPQPTSAMSVNYSISDLNSLTLGGYVRATGVNNLGQVVGTSTTSKRYYNNNAFRVNIFVTIADIGYFPFTVKKSAIFTAWICPIADRLT